MIKLVLIVFEYQDPHYGTSSSHYSHVCEPGIDPDHCCTGYVQYLSGLSAPLKESLLVEHEFPARIKQLHLAVLVTNDDLVSDGRTCLLVNFVAWPNHARLDLADARDTIALLNEARGLHLLQETFILRRLLLFFDHRYLVEHRPHNQQVKAVVDEPVGLR